MLNRNVYINEKNIWQTWGAEMTDGSFESLLTPPPAKEYIENESREEDGVRITVPPSGIRFGAKEVTVTVMITGKDQTDYLAKYSSFVNELINGKIALRIPELGKTFGLYYLSVSKYGSYGCNRGKFTVKLKEEKTILATQ